MTVAVIVVVVGAVLVWVFRPLVATTSRRMAHPDPRREAVAEKGRALAALVELEEDELAGKLTAEDAAGLRSRMEREAIAAIDRAASGQDADEALEKEIAEAARRLRP